MAIAATVVASVFAAAGARAEGDGSGNSSITANPSVVERPEAVSPHRPPEKSRGLLMPTPGMMPRSQLYVPGSDSVPSTTTVPPPRGAVIVSTPTQTHRPAPTPGGQAHGIRPLSLVNPTPTPRPQETAARATGANTRNDQQPPTDMATSRADTGAAPTPPPHQASGSDQEDLARLDSSTAAKAETVAASLEQTPTPPPREAETAAEPTLTPEPAGVSESAVSMEPSSTPQEGQQPLAPASQAEDKTASVPPASHVEKASLAPSEATGAPPDLLQVAFEPTEINLPGPSRSELKDFADRLRSDERLRVQLLAYADGAGLSPSKARRMSLSRALSVRSYLIENGIETSRIDVRALGNNAPSAPLDRVDVKVTQR